DADAPLAGGLRADLSYFVLPAVVSVPLALSLRGRRRARRLLAAGVAGSLVALVSATLAWRAILPLRIVAVAFVLLPRRLFFAGHDRRAPLVFWLATAGGLGALLGLAGFVERAQSLLDPGASGGRSELWAAAWRSFLDHPWAGLGAGSFQGR